MTKKKKSPYCCGLAYALLEKWRHGIAPGHQFPCLDSLPSSCPHKAMKSFFQQLLNHPPLPQLPSLRPQASLEDSFFGFPKAGHPVTWHPKQASICFHHTQRVLERPKEWASLASKVKPQESDKWQQPGLHPSWG